MLSIPGHIDRSLLDEHNMADLPDRTTLGELFSLLKLPENLHNPHLCRVNGERIGLEEELHEGDKIIFFQIMPGG